MNEEQVELCFFQFFAQRKILFRRCALPFKRFKPLFKLCKYVSYAFEILFRIFETPLGLLLARPVAHNARSLFKYHPALARLVREYLVYLPLPNY